jgi:hypothetical protein
VVVRVLPQQPATITRLVVEDGCGDWPTLVGGGVNAFPSSSGATTPPTVTATPTRTATAVPPTATPTATPTAKVPSVGAALSSLTLSTPQPASWANIPSPTQFDWLSIFPQGAADRDYIGSARFTSAQPAGTAIIPMPPDLDAGTYELRLFSGKSTDQRLAISNSFTVNRPPSHITPSVTPTSPATPVSGSGGIDSQGRRTAYASMRLDKWRSSSATPPRDIPVAAYYREDMTALAVARCGDPVCSFSAGTSIVLVDTVGDVGQYASLQLDNRINPADPGTPPNPFFYPVVSYYDATNGNLKILRCTNLNCSGSGHSITTADNSPNNVGLYTSLALDANGIPVVSYYDATEGNLKILRCGNLTCTDGNSIVAADTSGDVGQYTSLALDVGGTPVVSYYDASNQALKVLRCGNPSCLATGPNCAAGQNCIQFVDAIGQVGQYTSLALDGVGNPVISYYDVGNRRLKLAHCGTPDCQSSVITAPDAFGDVGQFTSLVLENTGRPAVSYYDNTNGRLKILRCGNESCTTGNMIGIVTGDPSFPRGHYTSLALSARNNPVVGYVVVVIGHLDLQHCDTLICRPANDHFADAMPARVGRFQTITDRATTEAGEPIMVDGACGSPTGMLGRTVWYTFTPTASGTATINTIGSSFDTVLAIYTGAAVDGLLRVACNNDAVGTQAQLSLPVVGGTTYRVQAGGFGGAAGNLTVNFTAIP